MANEKEKYIVIYNVLMDGSDRLSPDQLYFYALLSARKSTFTGLTETTLGNLLEEQYIFNDTSASRVVKKLKKLLLSLEVKKVISIKVAGAEIGKNSRVVISFPDFVEHEQIPRSIFDLASDPDEFFVLCFVYRFDERGGFAKAEHNWGAMMGYGAEKGIAVIKRMLQQGKITKEPSINRQTSEGKFNPTPPKFFINKAIFKSNELEDHLDTKLELKRVQTTKNEQHNKLAEIAADKKMDEGVNSVSNTATIDVLVTEILKRISQTNIGRKMLNEKGKEVNAPLDFDYSTYRLIKGNNLMTSETDKFVKQFEGLMSRYKSKEFYDGMFERYEEDYERKIRQKEYEAQNESKQTLLKTSIGTPAILKDATVVDLCYARDIDIEQIKEIGIKGVSYHFELGEIENIATISISEVFGEEDRLFSRDVRLMILNSFVQHAAKKKIDWSDINYFQAKIKEVIEPINATRSYNEVHEGDTLEYGIGNVSLRKRIQYHNSEENLTGGENDG